MKYLLAVLVAELRHRLIMLGYWIRPMDMMLDARRWRWQESGCAASRRLWLAAGPDVHAAARALVANDADNAGNA